MAPLRIPALARRPGLALAAVLSLAVGVGSLTSVVSYLDLLLWRKLPARDAAELVAVETRIGGAGGFQSSLAEARAYAGSTAVLSQTAAWAFSTPIVRAGDLQPVYAYSILASGSFFPLLGTVPGRGRLLGPEDDAAGAPRVTVLSLPFARRTFGAADAALGRRLELDGTPFTVVGVAPRGFLGAGLPAELYVPLASWDILRAPGRDWGGDPELRWLSVLGRLAPGVSRARAEEALGAVAAHLPSPAGDGARRVSVVPRERLIDPEVRSYLLPGARRLLAFVFVLFALALANAANLLVARGHGRRWEFAVRAAVGAGRGRLVAGLFGEGAALGLAGGAAGLLLARAGLRLLEGFLATPPTGFGHWVEGLGELHLDLRVLAAAAASSLAAGLVANLAPAVRLTSPRGLGALLGRQPGRAGARGWGRRAIPALQVAVAVWLAAATGVLALSLARLLAVHPGIAADRLALLTVATPQPAPGDERGARMAALASLCDTARTVPGVAGCALTRGVPLAGRAPSTAVRRPEGGEELPVLVEEVGPGYFATLGLPRLAGRGFDRGDRLGDPAVAVVSRRVAERLYPEGNPVGRRLRVPAEGVPEDGAEIVGVVEDLPPSGLGDPGPPVVYLPQAQHFRRRLTLLVRTAGEPGLLLPRLRREIARGRSDLAVVDAVTFRTHRERTLWKERMAARLVAGFGLLGLAVVALGVGGALAASVARRRLELGVRMAVGARRLDLGRLVLGEAVAVAAAGSALGLAAAVAFLRLLAGLVPGAAVRPEPLPLALAALLAAAVTFAAAAPPAARAARTDPMAILKETVDG